MMENAIHSDCPDTVSIVKMFYEDKNEEISEAAVEIARSRAVRRIVQMVDPGYEDDMEQRKADLKEKIMTGSAETTILGMKQYNCIYKFIDCKTSMKIFLTTTCIYNVNYTIYQISIYLFVI